MSGGDICVLDGCLVHEILSDGDGTVFKVIGLGEYPCVPRIRLIEAAIHSECVMDTFCVVEDTGGHTRD